MTTCARCGGLIMEPDKAYGWAGEVCHCLLPIPWPMPPIEILPPPTAIPRSLLPDPIQLDEKKEIPTGWQCPVCKIVNAPHIDSCLHETKERDK